MALIVWRETPIASASAPWDRPAAVRRLRTSLFMVTSMLVTMKSVKSACQTPDEASVRPRRVEKPSICCQRTRRPIMPLRGRVDDLGVVACRAIGCGR